MDIIFFGTPAIAIPTLEIIKQNYNIKLLVCQPDKPGGRGHKKIMPPTKEYALRYSIPIFQPEKIKNNEEAFNILQSMKPDFIIVVAYGKILPPSILNIPECASINVHFSLLPKYRGAAPVNWAIINGENFSGVSTMIMAEKLDAGDILLQKSVRINNKNSIELSNELSLLGGQLLLKTLLNFSKIRRKIQIEKKVSFAPILQKEDGLINWSLPAKIIERRIRGLLPWPACYSYHNNKVYKLLKASVVEYKHIGENAQPGTVVGVQKDLLLIKTGDGLLSINRIQVEGKKEMSIKDFLAGNKIKIGECFNS